MCKFHTCTSVWIYLFIFLQGKEVSIKEFYFYNKPTWLKLNLMRFNRFKPTKKKSSMLFVLTK